MPNSYVETLTSNGMVLGVEALGKWLGLDEVMRVEPPRVISVLIKERLELALFLP